MWVHVFVMWFLVYVIVDFVVHDGVVIQRNGEVKIVNCVTVGSESDNNNLKRETTIIVLYQQCCKFD